MEPGWALGAVPAIAFALAFSWEMVAPARPAERIDGRRWAFNLALFAINAAALALIAALLARFAPPDAAATASAGATLAAFLCLDAAGYGLHRLYHCWPALWRFHRLHHSDDDLDATTSVRHHVVEACATFLALGALAHLIGLAPPAFALYGTVLLGAQVLQHANIAWPRGLERVVGAVFVTSAFHEVHHIDDPAYHDRNFGMLFSVWDRLFGTYRERGPGAARFGVRPSPARPAGSSFTST